MTETLVDTNVILDVARSVESDWRGWSERRLAAAADEGALLVNQVIYAELAAGYGKREELDSALGRRFRQIQIPFDAAFAAGLAFLNYRRRGGQRKSPLPDFFIGAHAAVRGYRLLTRDRGYYAAYFPTLKIISPETHP